jgi:hypothetical protein
MYARGYACVQLLATLVVVVVAQGVILCCCAQFVEWRCDLQRGPSPAFMDAMHKRATRVANVVLREDSWWARASVTVGECEGGSREALQVAMDCLVCRLMRSGKLKKTHGHVLTAYMCYFVMLYVVLSPQHGFLIRNI